MTHAVAAWPLDRPGGVVVGKTTHVWCPRVHGRPELQHVVVGELRGHRLRHSHQSSVKQTE
eukprot:5994624-Prymnesium_polylepis.1